MKQTAGRPRAASPAGQPLSTLKRRLFTAFLVLLPLLVLVVTELILRTVEYGGVTELVVRRRFGAEEYYAINRSVAQRYFVHSGTVVPEPADDIFEIQKSPRTLRIFTLGESTMAGFPYEFHVTAPAFLRDRLQALFPERHVEVVNAGLSAVGSYIALDFMNELLEYEPDMFILYVGHNEFYGAYGVGSTVRVGGGHAATKLTLALLRFRTFMLIRDVVARLLAAFSRAPDLRSGTLMEQVVAEQEIPHGSPLYARAREIYRRNLRSILEKARERGIPVLVSTLVSNVRTQPPFRAGFAAETSDSARSVWLDLIRAGDSLRTSGRPLEAADRFRAAVAVDSMHGTGHFRLGQALYEAGKTQEARAALLRAKDLDLLRFRMSEEFQADLRTTCEELGAPVAGVDSAFAVSSPGGIVGNELILEHLHPTIGGYFLMGKTWCDAMREHALLVPADDWRAVPSPADSALFVESTASEFDSLLGRVRVDRLTRRWPFAADTVVPPYTPLTEPERIVWDYVRGKIMWSQARYQLSDHYAGRREYGRARRECLALSKASPFSYEPLLRVADYYALEGRNAEAKAAYARSIGAEDNPFARMKLSIVLINEGQAQQAVEQIEAALALERAHPQLDRRSTSSAHYFLAVACAGLGDLRRARSEAESALAIDAGNIQAREFLAQLPQ